MEMKQAKRGSLVKTQVKQWKRLGIDEKKWREWRFGDPRVGAAN